MNFDVDARTILLVKHGSHAYGLNVPTSDLDVKGVCIPPKNHYLGFVNRFEQHERMESKRSGVDSVVYSLAKFARLAADANPNIIEVLFVDDEDIVRMDNSGEQLRIARDEFISKRVKFTFSGYAHSQLKRIKTHRAWLLDPPKEPPSRREFGLPDCVKVSQSELGAFEAAVRDGIEVQLLADVLTLFTREKQYQAAKQRWDQYVGWKNGRNPARAELEAKFGYDTKHGMHLIRLMRMCNEILSTGRVLVRRYDKEDLLAIRRGERTYDSIVEEAELLDARCESLYATSTLRREPSMIRLDRIVIEITEKYLRNFG